MKKLILPLILMAIFLIPGTKVDADECVNLFNNINPSFVGNTSYGRWVYHENEQAFTPTYEIGKSYTFWINDASLPFSDYLNSNVTFSYFSLGNGFATLEDFSLTSFTFTANKISGRLYIVQSGPFNIVNEYQPFNDKLKEFWLVEGDSICTNVTQPEVPDPEEPVITPDTTLDNFYSIYFDKLTSLSNFAAENKFILSAITILLFVCCLELFLYLVRRRK